MYTTEEFYTSKYLQGRTAVLDTANFPYYERKASKIVQTYTFNRIDVNKPILDDVQMCVCELAEYLFKREISSVEEVLTKGITSERTHDHSITFATPDVISKQNSVKESKIILNWLTFTGLLYRGINQC